MTHTRQGAEFDLRKKTLVFFSNLHAWYFWELGYLGFFHAYLVSAFVGFVDWGFRLAFRLMHVWGFEFLRCLGVGICFLFFLYFFNIRHVLSIDYYMYLILPTPLLIPHCHPLFLSSLIINLVCKFLYMFIGSTGKLV
jgi:hypothetical protein